MRTRPAQLPSLEGLEVGRFMEMEQLSNVFRCGKILDHDRRRFSRETADDSPSPEGKGREGERVRLTFIK